MKTISAREAKDAFRLIIDTASAEPMLIGKCRRGVVMVNIVKEYERLSVRLDAQGKTVGQVTEGDHEMTNEACARIKNDQLFGDTD